jgi:hypothetical protein
MTDGFRTHRACTIRILSAWTLPNSGLAWHCVAGGFARALHSGVLYGLLLGVMAIPGHTYATTQTMLISPWIMKLIFGPLTDNVPLFGYRRRYYAAIGWTIVVLAHVVLLIMFSEPLPFYCSDESLGGRGDFRGSNGVCNSHAQTHASLVIGCLMFANIGLVLAESAGDGLLLECVTGMGDFSQRSSTQIEALVLRMIGGGLAALFLALCFNSRAHLGFYDSDIGMPGISAAMIALSILSIIGWILVTAAEKRTLTWNSPLANSRYSNGSSCGDIGTRYCTFFGKMCKPKFVGFLIYQLTVAAMLSFTSPAIDLMRKHWAHVQQMQQQLTFLGCVAVYAIALYTLHRIIEKVCWHNVVRYSIALQIIVQTSVYWITAIDQLRDQYFFLTSDLLQGLGVCVNYVIATLSLVEMAPRGHEASVYGIVGAIYAIAPAIGRSVANCVYGSIATLLGLEYEIPSLVHDENYIQDDSIFRAIVVLSTILSGLIAITSLLLLPLLPYSAVSARRFMTQSSNLNGESSFVAASESDIYSLLRRAPCC